MMQDGSNVAAPRWPHWGSIAVGIVVGALGMAGALSLRECRSHQDQRPQTSPVQGVGPSR